MTETRLVVADDHEIVRRGVCALLEADPEFQVVAETGDGLETLHVVEGLTPDVLVTDLMMPGLTGLELVRQVTARVPETRVLVLSMHSDDSHVLEAMRGGAAGYVLKESLAAEFVEAVRAVAAGRKYLCHKLSERAIAAYVGGGEAAPPDAYEALGPGERQVLHLAAAGHTGAEIAARLFISPRTVETRRQNFMRKLGLRTQTDLIRFALRRGILPPDL